MIVLWKPQRRQVMDRLLGVEQGFEYAKGNKAFRMP